MVWSEEEIEIYRQVSSPKLDDIYAQVGIHPTNPEERARYLAEDVLGLGMTDHDLVMRTAKQDGRPAALNLLEEWAVAPVLVDLSFIRKY